jgi:hypothetical protein
VLNFIKDNQDYVKFHKFVGSPEEIFFHSIIKSSPYASKISHDYGGINGACVSSENNELAAHYIDWSLGLDSPKVLTDRDFQRLVKSNAIFARKFDEFVSRNLLKMLEDEIFAAT